MTHIYIVKDANGRAVAGPFAVEQEAFAMAAIVTAPQPCRVEPFFLIPCKCGAGEGH